MAIISIKINYIKKSLIKSIIHVLLFKTKNIISVYANEAKSV